METLSMFIIMTSALLWMFCVPIALIVIAFNIVLIRLATEAKVATSEPLYDWDAVNKRAEKEEKHG